MGTTTINIRDEQHEALDDLKTHEREAFADVLDRLIDAYRGDAPGAEADGALDDFRAQLDRIEDAANTAESRTGSIERQLEEMGR
jgi:predicted CopG family antitoxin